MEDAHAKTVDEVLKHFNTNGDVGLTPDQVKQYQAKYGPNGESPNIILACPSRVSNIILCRKSAMQVAPKTRATE